MSKLPTLLVCAALIATATAGPAERVKEIRGWYDTIQKAQPAAKRTLKFESDDSPFSGTLTEQSYEGGWKSVVISYLAGDHSSLDEHYYLKDGELFFAYIITSTWQFDEGSTDDQPVTRDTRTEDRYYFDGGTCVRRLTRTAESRDGKKLAAELAKQEQKEIDPGEEAAVCRSRVKELLAAKTGADVLRAYEAE